MTSQEYDYYLDRAARCKTTAELKAVKLEAEHDHPKDPRLREIGEALAGYAADIMSKRP